MPIKRLDVEENPTVIPTVTQRGKNITAIGCKPLRAGLWRIYA
tara:strand:+ start:4364 stop:4492 length:129 start_codon:yes stop_codon:yes gene_type:complete